MNQTDNSQKEVQMSNNANGSTSLARNEMKINDIEIPPHSSQNSYH
jgi:hypothetical protein